MLKSLDICRVAINTPQRLRDQTSRVISGNAKRGGTSGIPITPLAQGVPAVELRKAGNAAQALTMCSEQLSFMGEGAAACKPVVPDNSVRLAFGKRLW